MKKELGPYDSTNFVESGALVLYPNGLKNHLDGEVSGVYYNPEMNTYYLVDFAENWIAVSFQGDENLLKDRFPYKIKSIEFISGLIHFGYSGEQYFPFDLCSSFNVSVFFDILKKGKRYVFYYEPENSFAILRGDGAEEIIGFNDITMESFSYIARYVGMKPTEAGGKDNPLVFVLDLQ